MKKILRKSCKNHSFIVDKFIKCLLVLFFVWYTLQPLKYEAIKIVEDLGNTSIFVTYVKHNENLSREERMKFMSHVSRRIGDLAFNVNRWFDFNKDIIYFNKFKISKGLFVDKNYYSVKFKDGEIKEVILYNKHGLFN